MDEAAYHGLAGELVRTIEPHSEADPNAILIQFLVAAGNAIGRGPRYKVEGDYHHTKLFVALVGATSDGRKRNVPRVGCCKSWNKPILTGRNIACRAVSFPAKA